MRFKIVIVVFALCMNVFSISYFVGVNGINGNGTLANPFNNFSSALNVAFAGDTIYVLPGTFNLQDQINTIRPGTAGNPIVITAVDPGSKPVLNANGTVLRIDHAYIYVSNFEIDGQFGIGDVVKIRNADGVVLSDCEIRNGVRDGVDLSNSNHVVIERCAIHHMLNGSYTIQEDAHGIVASGEKNFIIRECNIYYVSGDCIQTDPERGLPLWDSVLVENSKLWTGPLPGNAAAWNAGEIPGENAIDTKINPDSVSAGYRPSIILRNLEVFGFVPGFISVRAAFNIKENINCRIENSRVYNNEYAFRLRGPGSRGGAHVTIINCIAYNNDVLFRTEDDIELLHIYNGTFDKPAGGDYFENVSGGFSAAGFELMNSLFSVTKPPEAVHFSNLSATSDFFINPAQFDFHLADQSPAIDAGTDIPEVTEDFEGNPRIAGSYDSGAYEYQTVSGAINSPASPDNFILTDPYPNPFNPETNFEIYLPEKEPVQISIIDLSGKLVRSVLQENLIPGWHKINWDGKSNSGRKVSSGIYFCLLKTEKIIKTKKIILIK